MIAPDLLAELDERLADIEREAAVGRARITSGDAVNGSTALRRCYERAKDLRAELARGRTVKPVMRPEVREAMVLWARAGICTVCGQPACRPVRGHHVLEQNWLRSRARTLRIDAVPLLEDRCGWLRVGDRCHERHHNAVVRIPRLVLVEHCPDVFAFAAEYGLSERLNRTYPDVTAEAAA